ncbi:MAG: hypothetical protein AAFP00_06265 [Bacteroidota bacterium]
MRYTPIYTLLLCLWGIVGCEILDETTRLQTPDWQPDIAIPLIDASVSIEDLLDVVDSSTFLTFDPEGRVGLTYETDLITATGKDIVVLPNLFIPMPSEAIAFTFPLTSIQTIGLAQGQLSLAFNSNTSEASEVTLNIQGLKKEGLDFSQTFSFNGIGAQREVVDL